jgi:predicted enzyme related to lactoylglutathione lyase
MAALDIQEIAFIGHPVSDVPRARHFYEGILGLKPAMAHEIQPGQWWIEYEIAGLALALSNAWPPTPNSGPTVALEVADLDAAAAALANEGVAVDYGPMDTPVCRFFGIRDPDGNSITIHQRRVASGA